MALLAFAGNIGKTAGNPASLASHLGNSLISFGAGALFGALAFVAAYLTQLQYAPVSRSAHSDSVMDWLNSEVAPSADVSVAVNEAASRRAWRHQP